MRSILLIITLLVTGHWSLVTASPIQAQFNIHDQYFAEQPRIGGVNSVYDLLNAILPNVYIIAGLILFLYTLVGGFLLITAGSSADQAKNGQKIITNAIIGFIILFASYWLIQIIEIITGVKILEPTLSF